MPAVHVTFPCADVRLTASIPIVRDQRPSHVIHDIDQSQYLAVVSNNGEFFSVGNGNKAVSIVRQGLEEGGRRWLGLFSVTACAVCPVGCKQARGPAQAHNLEILARNFKRDSGPLLSQVSQVVGHFIRGSVSQCTSRFLCSVRV